MPTSETHERFIARVEQNAHAEAVQEFYSADASMQENQSGHHGRGRVQPSPLVRHSGAGAGWVCAVHRNTGYGNGG